MGGAQASKSVGRRQVNRLAQDLAKQAGITIPQAAKVLQLFHIDKLVENANALQAVLRDEATVRALALGEARANKLVKQASPASFTFANMRLSVKPSGAEDVPSA